MTSDFEAALAAAKIALKTVQEFDAESIVRADALGLAFDFRPAEDSAKHIVDLFKQIDPAGLQYLPLSSLSTVQSLAEQTIQIFQQATSFDPKTTNAAGQRDSIISLINSHVSTLFNTLSPTIAYLGLQQVGANQTIIQLTKGLNEAKVELDRLITDANAAKQATDDVLETARAASGKVGVVEEARYFGDAADAHRMASDNWKSATIGASVILVLYAVCTAFLHKWNWFMPTNNIQLTQFLVSKILIFGVLAYLLNLCARNFLNHKHNEIVNRHRQNSLLTYETMVNAGQTNEARNIVLELAAASIYQLHDTGYVKSSDGSSRGILEILPKTSVPIGPSS